MNYTIKIEDQTYQVEIQDLYARPIVAIVGGERFEIWPENDQKIKPTTTRPAASAQSAVKETAQPPVPSSLAKPAAESPGDDKVRAPIPGVIVAIHVKPGDQIVYGQELITIEAMKMKNAIRAVHDGQVSEVHVTPGQTVNHNALLISFVE